MNMTQPEPGPWAEYVQKFMRGERKFQLLYHLQWKQSFLFEEFEIIFAFYHCDVVYNKVWKTLSEINVHNDSGNQLFFSSHFQEIL